MLVLSRKKGERIMIGDGVVVKVISVKGNRVKLGIEAPDSVRIKRSELPDLPKTPPSTNKPAAA